MAGSKYGEYVITGLNIESDGVGTHLFCLHDGVIKGAPYVETGWYRPRTDRLMLVDAHAHDFPEVIGFFGTNPDDPGDLGGEIELWLGDERHLLKRSGLVFVPGGLPHCPMIVGRLDRRVFVFSTGPDGRYRGPEHFPGEKHLPKGVGETAPAQYDKFILSNINIVPDDVGIHLFCLSDEVIKGAPYVDCGWYRPGSSDRVLVDAHTHDFHEVVTFFGSDPDNPGDLGGEVEFWLGEERHVLTRSCVIVVPKGVKHCPLIIRRVERPIFHFATASQGGYSGPELFPA